MKSVLIGLVLVALGFGGGYYYATRDVGDTGPDKPHIVYRDRPIVPPDTVKIQTPVTRTIYQTVTDTVCLEADVAFLRAGGIKLESNITLNAGPNLYEAAVTYVDPSTERLAVTRNRKGDISIPYTWRGSTRVDTYTFPKPKWDIYLEAEGRLLGDTFALVAPTVAQASVMAWLRLRSWHVGLGAQARVEDGDAGLGSVVGVRRTVWGLR